MRSDTLSVVTIAFRYTVLLWNVRRNSAPHTSKATTHPRRPRPLIWTHCAFSKVLSFCQNNWDDSDLQFQPFQTFVSKPLVAVLVNYATWIIHLSIGEIKKTERLRTESLQFSLKLRKRMWLDLIGVLNPSRHFPRRCRDLSSQEISPMPS